MTTFTWRDLLSVDPDASAAFFTELFAWTEESVQIEPFGTYRRLSRNGEPIGGIVPLDAALGHPSHWVSYVSVRNVDAAAGKAARLGGTVVTPPSEIPGVGRFAALTDRQGALFCIMRWNADRASPADAEPGEAARNELLTADPSSAAAFYGKLFNWELRSSQDPRGAYRTMVSGGEHAAGVLKRPDGMRMSSWLVYFEVADLDAALGRVIELGGRVVSETMSSERSGRFAYAADPTEAGFGLTQSPR